MKTSDLPSGIRSHTLDSGEIRYEARVHRSNALPLSKRFKTVKEATTWKSQADALIEGGIDPKTVLGKKGPPQSLPATSPAVANPSPSTGGELTVKQAVKNYLSFRQKSHNPLPSNSATDYEKVAGDFGDFLVTNLRNEDLSNYITVLLRTPLKRDVKRQAKGTLKGPLRTYKQATVRKFLFAIKVALEWNAKNGKTELSRHLFAFERKTMPSAWAGKRDRRLHAGEEERLYAAGISRSNNTYSESDWRAVIGFALESAMREQEITLAQWSDVTPSGARLHIPGLNTKTKTARTIKLSKRAMEIIRLQREDCPKNEKRIFYQFPNAQALCEAFARLRERASIPDLHFHDFRHEATSRLCESGKEKLVTIMQMTGHKDMATFGGYFHLSEEGITDTMD